MGCHKIITGIYVADATLKVMDLLLDLALEMPFVNTDEWFIDCWVFYDVTAAKAIFTPNSVWKELLLLVTAFTTIGYNTYHAAIRFLMEDL